MARKCLSRAKIFSTRCLYLYKHQSMPALPIVELLFLGMMGIDIFRDSQDSCYSEENSDGRLSAVNSHTAPAKRVA